MPAISIEITGIEGESETVEPQVRAILDSLINRENFNYLVDIRPCIYAAILDTPTRWEATAHPLDKRDDAVDCVRVFE